MIAECNLAVRSETATNLFTDHFSRNQNSESLFCLKTEAASPSGLAGEIWNESALLMLQHCVLLTAAINCIKAWEIGLF